MKKGFLSFLTVAFVSFTASSQAEFGIHAGGHLASATEKFDGKKQDGSKSLFGFKAGGIARIPVSDQFSFMPELNFVSKGGKVNSKEVQTIGPVTTTIESDGELKMSFIELPLNLAFNSASEDGSGFFGGIGPVISFGMGGKTSGTAKTTIEITGFPTQTSSSSYSGDIVFDGKANATDGKGHLNGFEFGGNVFAGYKLSSGLFVKALYHTGFSNLSPEDKTTLKTSYFGLGIGYFFGGSN